MSSCLSPTDFAAPVTDRWFEDYIVGSVYEYGYVSVSQDDIIEFALRYDPQPIHIDVAAAQAGPFHGIIASGAQTIALSMGLYVTHYISHCASLASPGLDEIRWNAPLRPDDQIRIQTEILSSRVSSSKPDRGIIQTKMTTFNQNDVAIMTLTAANFMKCRPV